MIKSNWCDYSDRYILFKGTISVLNTASQDAVANNTNKKVIFKKCAQIPGCMFKINNIQVDGAQDIDIVMLCIL